MKLYQKNLKYGDDEKMKCVLKVYKGFELDFLKSLKELPLVNDDIEHRIQVLNMDEEYLRKMLSEVVQFRSGVRWITYEEFSRLYEDGIQLLKTMGIEVIVEKNNIYPDVYPLLGIYEASEIERFINLQENFDEENSIPSEYELFKRCYSEIIEYYDTIYIKYKNYEIGDNDILTVEHYPVDETLISSGEVFDIVFEITDNEFSYLNILHYTKNNEHKKIGIVNSVLSRKTNLYKQSLHALIKHFSNNNVFVEANNTICKNVARADFNVIAKETIKIPDFVDFNELDIYKCPYEGNEIQKVSQNEIIETIVSQAERAYGELLFHDVFVTAPTGAGKSIIFQIPAVYLSGKYNKLTVVISPLVELMNDQVINLRKRGYFRAARLNSDLNVNEREAVLADIRSNKIDILYLGPETLLSYSIDSIIGNRELGLVIIDEAHIVTTWGQGFRPDYWYLGSYINRIRKSTNGRGIIDKNKRKHNFPICAFTATAVCGGKNDTVGETIISLFMNDPIKYIGKVKRDNIAFEINYNEGKLNHTQYEDLKQKIFSERVINYIGTNEKTLAYFPYDSYAKAAKVARDGFVSLNSDSHKIGIYTGKTTKSEKQHYAKEFRRDQIKVMFATKAFGMGIDIKDIQNVLHYAPTGNLNDYVQEIGRAARKKEIAGKAIIDFFDKDMNFIKKLFGMSAIREYHVKRALAVIYDAYQANKKQRFLITPKMFAHIFHDTQDEAQLENKVKTTLLTIEKDLEATFHLRVLLTRPKSMFTQTFVVIDNSAKDFILSSKYGRFFSLIGPGRNGKKSYANCYITDVGDVFKADLKGIWESFYPYKSFAEFKHCFYNKDDKTVLTEIKEFIYPRVKLEIEVKNEKCFADLKKEALLVIGEISDVLLQLKQENKFFNKETFANKLEVLWSNKLKAASVANAYMEMITEGDRKFYTTREEKDEQMYYIENSIFRSQAEKMIHQSNIIKSNFANCMEDRLVLYTNCNDDVIKNDLKLLNLFMLLDLIHYNISGGDNPEIYVFLSDPYKINNILNGRIKYENALVKEAKKKHEDDVKIMTHFFTKLTTNEERWRYIEDYYLGTDLEEKYNI